MAAPPKHLSRASKTWWRQVDENYRLESWQFRSLQVACEAFDRMTEARAAVNGDLTVKDRFGIPKPNPLLAVERDSRIAYLRAVRELGLEVDR